jgi:hypothetical protein
MSDDSDLYDLRLTFRVKLKKWRVDDQHDRNNQEWSLRFWDRNLEEWKIANESDLNRPGEQGYIESIQIITNKKGG